MNPDSLKLHTGVYSGIGPREGFGFRSGNQGTTRKDGAIVLLTPQAVGSEQFKARTGLS